ncbi:MAG: DUF433 domain-containing protein [bacterium]
MSTEPISKDPDRMSGKPTFTGTRVPVKTLFEYLEAGDPTTDFLEDFPTVSHEQVKSVLELAEKEIA